MYDLYCKLGCFGLRTDDFVSCGGVENTILGINAATPNYNQMLDYFDQLRLFDKPLFDLNAIRHFIFNMQDRYDQITKPLWSAKKFELYQKFVIDHRYCGLFIKLECPDGQIVQPEPKPVVSDVVTNKLRLIRGRRSNG